MGFIYIKFSTAILKFVNPTIHCKYEVKTGYKARVFYPKLIKQKLTPVTAAYLHIC